MATLNLDQIKEALAGNAAAFRSVTEYQPAGGPGDKANRDIPRRHRVRATAYPTGHAPPWGVERLAQVRANRVPGLCRGLCQHLPLFLSILYLY